MPTQLIRALLNIKAGAAFKMTSMKARLAARAGVHLYIYMYVTFFFHFPCISWIFGFTLEVYGFPKLWAQDHGSTLWVPKCQSGLTWALNFSETDCHFPRRFASRETPGRDYQKPNAFTPLNHILLAYFGTYFDIRALRTHVILA